MTPTNTRYRLARPGGEFNKLYAMVRRTYDGRAAKMVWPVVVAERGETVVGCLGCLESPLTEVGNLVATGPLMALRLGEALENVLRFNGIKLYLFSVPKGNLSYINAVKQLGMPQIGENDNYLIFKREL